MSIAEQIANAFPKASSWIGNTDIEDNPNLMELVGSIDLIAAVPAYMLWCTRNPDSPELVLDFTVAALAEYGRCKNLDSHHLNFRFLCSADQIEAVVAFLEWASQALSLVHHKTIDRALRNWRNAVNGKDGPSLP